MLQNVSYLNSVLTSTEERGSSRDELVCLQIDRLAFAEEFTLCSVENGEFNMGFFYQVGVYFIYFILLLCTVTASHKK